MYRQSKLDGGKAWKRGQLVKDLKFSYSTYRLATVKYISLIGNYDQTDQSDLSFELHISHIYMNRA